MSRETKDEGREPGSAGFPACCVADFQVGKSPDVMRPAGSETRDTAGLETCATTLHFSLVKRHETS